MANSGRSQRDCSPAILQSWVLRSPVFGVRFNRIFILLIPFGLRFGTGKVHSDDCDFNHECMQVDET